MTGHRYRLLPVFSNLIPPDAEMAAYIERAREPFEKKLAEPLAVTEGTLYRRGSYNGSFDQLILDALLAQKGTQIAFSPGFRWGTTLLPGEAITLEHLMDQTAITYPQVTVNSLTGTQIKAVLEDIADNLFHADPYSRQGGDMVRVAGMTYAHRPRRRDRRSHLRHEGPGPADGGGEPPTRSPAGRRCRKGCPASRCGTWSAATCARSRPCRRCPLTAPGWRGVKA